MKITSPPLDRAISSTNHVWIHSLELQRSLGFTPSTETYPDIYYEATAMPHLCGMKRNEMAAKMQSRTYGEQHALTRKGVQ